MLPAPGHQAQARTLEAREEPLLTLLLGPAAASFPPARALPSATLSPPCVTRRVVLVVAACPEEATRACGFTLRPCPLCLEAKGFAERCAGIAVWHRAGGKWGVSRAARPAALVLSLQEAASVGAETRP